MITTTVAGRTWNFSHAIGLQVGIGNISPGAAGFAAPTAVTTAPGGVLYVLSRGHAARDIDAVANQRIAKLTIDEEFLGEFGRREFTWPVSLAVDREGNIYCSDEYLNIIAIYDTGLQRQGQWGVTGSGRGQLNGAAGIAFDSEDNLYVVDSLGDRVQKFTRDGQYLLGWGASGQGHGQFNRPWGITTGRDGNVYVADWGNDRCQKFTSEGEFLVEIGGPGDGPGGLKRPSDVAVDTEGDVYVTDWGNMRVQIYASDGDPITSLRGDAHKFSKWAQEMVNANPDFVKAYNRVEDLSPLYRFDRPTGITMDDQDRIIVTDTNRCRLQVYAKEKDYLEPQFNL